MMEGVYVPQKSPASVFHVPKSIPSSPWPYSDISEPKSSAPARLGGMQGEWRISWCPRVGVQVFHLHALPADGPR